MPKKKDLETIVAELAARIERLELGRVNARDLLSLPEVATYLGLHLDTVRRFHREKGLPVINLGRDYRVRRVDLDKWLDSRRKAG